MAHSTTTACVEVPALTFDGEVAGGHIPLDDLGLAWIDVQGHELEVLQGARSLLAAGVPLVIEFASAMGDRAHLDELADLLADSYEVMVDLGWCALTNRAQVPAGLGGSPACGGRTCHRDGPLDAPPADVNVVFLSPHFPPNWFRFVLGLRNAGATTMGICDQPRDTLRPDLRECARRVLPGR